jgi:sporulation protein YlmC with PRC-barrel domain
MAHESTQTGRVQGSPVFDELGERIGSIVELTINKMAGQVCEVLLEIGGILGVGATRCLLPWSALTYSSTLNGYVVARARAKPDHSVDEAALSALQPVST